MSVLATQSQFCNQGSVALHVLVLEVPKQSSTLTDHHEQTTPAVMVLLVDLQVLGEVVYALGQQCRLDLGRSRVGGMRAVFFYNSLRVVHEVFSYASKQSGDRPVATIAASRTTRASNPFHDESHPRANDRLDLDLYPPHRVQEPSNDDHRRSGF